MKTSLPHGICLRRGRQIDFKCFSSACRHFYHVFLGVYGMSERMSRLRAHERNIDRYQRLLETKLNETEFRFVRQRLSEECFALAILQAMSQNNLSKEDQLPDALQ
jgi:hypothetical protein